MASLSSKRVFVRANEDLFTIVSCCMQHLLFCPRCRFWRDGLRVLSCCSTKICAECTMQLSACPTCSAPLTITDDEYKPYKVLVESVMRKCRYPGCDYQTTDILIAHHESNCPKQPMSEVVAALGDSAESPAARAMRINANLSKLRPARVVVEEQGKKYIEHLVLRTDTLVGLSMKYGVSGRDIQLANHLATGNIHERTRLKIPSAQGKVPPEDNQVEVIAALKRLAVSKFKAATCLKDTEEANYYLDSADYDLDAAIKAFRADSAWADKTLASSSSCVRRLASIPPPPPSSSPPSSLSSITPGEESAPLRRCMIRTPSPPPNDPDPPPSFVPFECLLEPATTTTTSTSNACHARPNMLQELLCCCLFSPRTRR